MPAYKRLAICLFYVAFTFGHACRFSRIFHRQVEEFGELWKNFTKYSLGADYLQNHFDENSNRTIEDGINAEDIFNEIVDNLEKRVSDSNKEIRKLKTYVDKVIQEGQKGHLSELCCGYNRTTEWSDRHKDMVDNSNVCAFRLDHKELENVKFDAARTLEKFKDVTDRTKNLYTYLGTENGTMIMYPAKQSHITGDIDDIKKCREFDPRYRPWYVRGVSPKKGRAIVIAIDFGAASAKRNKTAIEVLVDKILLLTGSQDKVIVRTYQSNEGDRHPKPSCFETFMKASPGVRDEITGFIRGLSFSGRLVSYEEVLKDAYSLLGKEKDSEKHFHFISSIHFKEINNFQQVYTTVKIESETSNCSIIMNLFLLKDQLSEKDKGDYQKIITTCWKTCTCSTKDKGKLIIVPENFSPEDLQTTSNLASKLERKYTDENDVYHSEPYLDFNGAGLLLDLCTRNLDRSNKVVALSCVSYSMSSYLETSRINDANIDAYALLINKKGIVYLHPLMEYPTKPHQRTFLPHIKMYETSDNFSRIFESVITDKQGRESVTKIDDEGNMKKYEYIWRQVNGTDFIMVLATHGTEHLKRRFDNLGHRRKEVYHRLDLRRNDTTKYCKLFEEILTKDASTVMFHRNLFKDPNNYYLQETQETVRKIEKFLSGESEDRPGIFRTIREPTSIRETVTATNVMYEYWKNDSTEHAPFAVWRYVGSPDGTYRIYPGTRMNALYDPRKRPWYKRAVASPSEMIITEPYHDAATDNSIIVSAAKALKYQSNKNQIAGVISVDFTIPHFKHKLGQYIEACRSENPMQRCMVIDKAGVLLYHPRFVNLTTVNERHLAELEPVLANHLVQKNIMKKQFCVGYNIVLQKQTAPTPYVRYFYSLEHLNETEAIDDDCWFYLLEPIKGLNTIVIYAEDFDCDEAEKRKLGLGECHCPKQLQRCEKSRVDNLTVCECPCYDFKPCVTDLPARNETKLCPVEPPTPTVNYTNNWITNKDDLPECIICSKFSKHECESHSRCDWCDHDCKGTYREEHVMRCRYRGTCCSTPPLTPPIDRKIYKTVIAVILPCIFILACAICLLCGAKKRAKLCGLKRFDESNNTNGETNGGIEHYEPRAYVVRERRNSDEIRC